MVNQEKKNLFTEPIIKALKKNKIFVELCDLVNEQGYNLTIDSGIIIHEKYEEVYISFDVITKDGKTIPDADFGHLTAYEPVLFQYKNGKERVSSDCLDELIDSAKSILTCLKSNHYLVALSGNLVPGTYESKYGFLKISKPWKLEKQLHAFVQLDAKPHSVVPSYLETIEINGVTLTIVGVGIC